MRKYSKEIIDAIISFLDEDDWHYSFDEKEGVIKFGLSTKGKIKNLNYRIRVYDDKYTVYVFSPIGVDPDDKEMMSNMSEFICRANYGLQCGNFEMDYDDGEIRYKTYVSCKGRSVPTKESIKESIYCPAYMFDKYDLGITDVIFSQKKAKDAIERCENSLEAELHEMLEEITTGEGNEDVERMLMKLSERFGESDDSEKSSITEDVKIISNSESEGAETVEAS